MRRRYCQRVAALTDTPSVLAALRAGVDMVVVRDGVRTIVAAAPSDAIIARGPGSFEAIDELVRRGGWWAGFLSYDLGRHVEAVPTRIVDDLGVPDVVFARFDARLLLEPGLPPRIEGHGEGQRVLREALERSAPSTTRAPDLHSWTSSLTPDEWRERVAAIHELLRDGECYQVNLTRRLSTPGTVDPRALSVAVHDASPAPHGALVDLRSLGSPAVVSASPERFLARTRRTIETRPIKGTDRDATWLATSAKNRAENVMIVDLARNDLGRICEPGSIDVPELCVVEHHPGLHHLVSTVRGKIEPDVTISDILRATFPPASVTGAPKPRVLRVIEELETTRRGVYCGAIGWIDADQQELDLNVAIRTFTITREGTHLGVGGGIVADSVADDEWNETCLKAHRLLAAAGQPPDRVARGMRV